MTNSPTPGPELDAMVAEKAMGWQATIASDWKLGGEIQLGCADWRPSTDIAQAFQVVERMRKYFGVEIRALICPERWRCEFNDPGDPIICDGVGHTTTENSDEPWQWVAVHESLPTAICLAALAAVRGKSV